jgi:nitrogen fixation protein FixH
MTLWGKGVVGAFVLFVVVMLGIVFFAMTRDVDLVIDHPYERGLEYDTRIRAMERAAGLSEGIEVSAAPEAITVQFPDTLARPVTGTITLYRPSDRTRDRTILAEPDSTGRQRIPAVTLDRGLWRVRVACTSRDREFFVEQPVMLR